MTRKLSAFWHKVQRWTTTCFSCTPTDILAVEACLPPLDLLLAYKYQLACLRVMCSPLGINPAATRLHTSLMTPSMHRHAPDHRILSRGNLGAILPLLWRRPRPPANNRTHLLLDTLPPLMLFALGPDGSAPLPVTSQHLIGESYPAPPPSRTYPQLELLCKRLLMEEWELAAPDPARYAFRPLVKPHPFMGPSKFDATRLHQMRSGKSYLCAHPSWANPALTTFPSCEEAHETFEHGMLHCSGKRAARDGPLHGVSELGPDAPVWSSAALLGVLTGFVRSTATEFPPGLFSHPSSSPESVSSRSSNVGSFRYFLSSQAG